MFRAAMSDGTFGINLHGAAGRAPEARGSRAVGRGAYREATCLL